MKSSKKSLNSKFGKKYQNAGTVTPLFPKSGPELTYPADVTYGQENLTGSFPTGQPLTEFNYYKGMSDNPTYSNPSNMFKVPASPGNYTTPNQPQGTITNENYSFAPGVFSDKQAQSTFTPMMSPLNIYDVNPNTSQVEQGPLTQGQVSDRGAQGEEIKPNNKFKLPNLDYNSALTLGLGVTSTLLNRNQDQQNRRMLNQSIQNRQSTPVYDYNYMYGRTTSGGTEYQPIVKAEMGAQINKRYNTPSPINNVEIEGGEFLQLPDMSTEMAYGPSHSNGGIQTSLPEGTKVFSNHLKPMGSKKTFAQMAKKYDNTEYDKILDNKFAKQVDKDTAMLMKQKNQTMLNKLFMDQQLLNGNSNGEPMNMPMAKNGASIDNAGFRALPKSVQEKILSNMESGGFSLPNPLYMQDGAWYNENQWNAATQTQGTPLPDLSNMFPRVMANSVTQPNRNGVVNPFADFTSSSYGGMGTTPLPSFGNMPSQQTAAQVNPFAQSSPSASQQTQQTQQATAQPQTTNRKNTASAQSVNQSVDMNSLPENLRKYAKWDTGKNKFRLDVPSGLSPQELSTIANEAESYGISKLVQSGSNRLKGPASEYSGFYAGLTPQDFEKKIVLEELGEEGIKGLSEQDLRKKAFDLMGVDYSNLDITDAKKLYNDPKFRQNQLYTAFTKYLPQDQFRKELKDDFKLGFEHYDAIKGKPKTETPATTEKDTSTETKEKPNTPDFQSVEGKESGKYYRQPFPLMQAIPGVLGLANSQEIFPYAIPEIDSQYIRPQTLNIQSQLQDVDNMGQAAVRAGADPLSAYIAGVGGKEKAYQTKQNFDAQGRMQADMFNAQSKMQSDMMNAQMFDRTYNNLIAQARDAQTAEQQAALTNIINNYSKYNQDENLKSLYLDNLQSAFDIGKDRPFSMTVDPKGRPVFSFDNVPKTTTETTTEDKKPKTKSVKKSPK
jgi:hypothetical protein